MRRQSIIHLSSCHLLMALYVFAVTFSSLGQGTRVTGSNGETTTGGQATPARRYAVVKIPDGSTNRLSDQGIIMPDGFLDMNRNGIAIKTIDGALYDLNTDTSVPLRAPTGYTPSPWAINDDGQAFGFLRIQTPNTAGNERYGFWSADGSSFTDLPGLNSDWFWPGGPTEFESIQEHPFVHYFVAAANGGVAVSLAEYLNNTVGGSAYIGYPGPFLVPENIPVNRMNNKGQAAANGVIFENWQIVQRGVYGTGINGKDQIVGSGTHQASVFERFEFPNGDTHWDELNLNDLILEGQGWLIDSASDINNNGVILASGRQFADPNDPTRKTDEGNVILLKMEIVKVDTGGDPSGDFVPSTKGKLGQLHFVTPKAVDNDFVTFECKLPPGINFSDSFEWFTSDESAVIRNETIPAQISVKRGEARHVQLFIRRKQTTVLLLPLNVWVVWATGTIVRAPASPPVYPGSAGTAIDGTRGHSSVVMFNGNQPNQEFIFKFSVQPYAITDTSEDIPTLNTASDPLYPVPDGSHILGGGRVFRDGVWTNSFPPGLATR